jgi:hypothetical protein
MFMFFSDRYFGRSLSPLSCSPSANEASQFCLREASACSPLLLRLFSESLGMPPRRVQTLWHFPYRLSKGERHLLATLREKVREARQQRERQTAQDLQASIRLLKIGPKARDRVLRRVAQGGVRTPFRTASLRPLSSHLVSNSLML